MSMAGRFTARRSVAARSSLPVEPTLPRSRRCRGRCSRSREPSRTSRRPTANPLLTDKLLDAKVRLHRRLIEEINLSALEKLPEDEMRAAHPAARHAIHPGRAAGAQHAGAQRLRLGNSRRDDRASARSSRCSRTRRISDILINGHECVYVERGGLLEPMRRAASRTRRICCASSTRSSRRSAAGSTNRIRCATRACSTARASTSRCGRSASTGRWSRSANSPRSRST